jgi:hypothetical protein
LLNLGAFAVSKQNGIGQTFKPSLPGGVTHWRVTRALLSLSRSGTADGEARVELRRVQGTTPGVILDEAPLYESDLGTGMAWRESSFRQAEPCPADAALCLVVRGLSDSNACNVEFESLLASASDGAMIRTGNGGTSWSAPLGQDLRYYVYGTYSSPNATGLDYWLTLVSCTVQSGGDRQGRISTTIRVLNEPQVSGP